MSIVLLLLAISLVKAQAVSDAYQYSVPEYNEMPEMYREEVNKVTSSRIMYELDTDDVHIDEKDGYSGIVVDGFYQTYNPGMPMLPIRYFEIPVPSYAKSLTIRITGQSYDEINVDKKIKPFVPEEDDFFDSFYEHEAYDEYSSSPGLVTVDFGYRGKQKYALVRYYPFGYDSEEGKLNITTSAVLEIGYESKSYMELGGYYSAVYGGLSVSTTAEPTAFEVLGSGEDYGEAPELEWERLFGGKDSDEGRSVQQTLDGGYIIAGYTKSFGCGSGDVYLIKTDSDGNMQWNKTFGGSMYDSGYSVQQTSDGGYIIGGYTGSFGVNFYLVKTYPNGEIQWNKTFGGSDAYVGRSVQQTSDGGYIIGGYISSWGGRDEEIYLVKTDSKGNEQWNKTLAIGSDTICHSVKQTSDGGYILTGYTKFSGNYQVVLIKTYHDGNIQWYKTFGGSSMDIGQSVQQTSDGGYIIGGYAIANHYDFYLIKTDSNGNAEWQKTFGGWSVDKAYSVWQTSDGGYILAGVKPDYIYLVKTDSNGKKQWDKTLPQNMVGGVAYSVQQTLDGGYILTGSTSADVYLAKLGGPCSNQIKDNDETDTDCGDSCSPCDDGKSCLADSDCMGSYCNDDNICETILDLSAEPSAISFAMAGDDVEVSAVIRNNGKSPADSVEVKFLDKQDNNLIKETTLNIGSIPAESYKTASVTWDLETDDVVYVMIDPDNRISELDEGNNNAYKQYRGSLKYYVKADVPPSKASDEIESYIKDNLKDGIMVDDKEEADVIVLAAGYDNPLIKGHFFNDGWGSIGGAVGFSSDTCNKPYCGIVGEVIKDGKKEIYIEANDIDGFIAASKAFIKEQDSFKSAGSTAAPIFLGHDNIGAIAVYDYLHTSVNLEHYKEDSDGFKEIVRKALNGERVFKEDKTVDAAGVTLRLRNIKPGYSSDFMDYKDELKLPVVLARGAHSNLTSWEDFGVEIADEEVKDTWLIEITGGPGQDCDECPNYDFDDLTDSYVPALLNKVLTETGKDKLQYVGFSNGCRATLSALEKGSFDSNKIETFVAVGCPGAFEGESPAIFLFREFGDVLLDELKGKNHLTASDIGDNLKSKCIEFGWLKDPIKRANCYFFSKGYTGKGKISYNLASQYSKWMANDTDTQPGTDIKIENFKTIYGTLPNYEDMFVVGESDGVVPKEDAIGINKNIEVTGLKPTPKKIKGVHHTKEDDPKNSLPDKTKTKKEIIEFLRR
ncbi:hypothetical protein KY366_06865 [Candidatus Woesearchaeota archaeon]|nr:hypothetical protein [Candidatus Woesearchaeota archaeon]